MGVAKAAGKFNMPELVTHFRQQVNKLALAGSLNAQDVAMLTETARKLNMPHLGAVSMRSRTRSTASTGQDCVLTDLKCIDVGNARQCLENDLLTNSQLQLRRRELECKTIDGAKMPCGAKYFGRWQQYTVLCEALGRSVFEPKPWHIFVSSDLVDVVKAIVERKATGTCTGCQYCRGFRKAWVRDDPFVAQLLE